MRQYGGSPPQGTFFSVLHCHNWALKFTCSLSPLIFFFFRSIVLCSKRFYSGAIGNRSAFINFLSPPNPHRLHCTNIWSFGFCFHFIIIEPHLHCLLYSLKTFARWKPPTAHGIYIWRTIRHTKTHCCINAEANTLHSQGLCLLYRLLNTNFTIHMRRHPTTNWN